MIKQALLTVFITLLVGGFVLIWDSPPESFMTKSNKQMDKSLRADSYMTGVVSQRFSELGGKQFSLSSPHIDFFQDESMLNIQQPRFLAQDDKHQPILLTANSGYLNSASSRLDLDDNVRAEMTTAEGVSELTTEHLAFLIDSSVATTDQPFDLLTNQGKASGTGLEIDLVNETFAIQSKVRVTHDPR